jgi:hypothetical protein
MKRMNKDRRYPGTRGPRPDNVKIKREEAVERKTAWDALSIKERLAVLDTRLGPGQGAQRQRAKLMAQLERPTKAAPAVDKKSSPDNEVFEHPVRER